MQNLVEIVTAELNRPWQLDALLSERIRHASTGAWWVLAKDNRPVLLLRMDGNGSLRFAEDLKLEPMPAIGSETGIVKLALRLTVPLSSIYNDRSGVLRFTIMSRLNLAHTRDQAVMDELVGGSRYVAVVQVSDTLHPQASAMVTLPDMRHADVRIKFDSDRIASAILHIWRAEYATAEYHAAAGELPDLFAHAGPEVVALGILKAIRSAKES